MKCEAFAAIILMLTSCTRATSLNNESLDAGVEGAYVLDAIDNRSVPENRFGWAKIDLYKGCLAGDDGVNGIRSSYRAHANHIEIGEIVSQLALNKLLPPGTSLVQSAAYAKLLTDRAGARMVDRLSTANTYRIMGSSFTLSNPEGRTLTFQRVGASKRLGGECPAWIDGRRSG